jgi:hypothetical protein
MAKFKPAKGKRRNAPAVPQGAVPCLFLVFAALVLFGLLFFFFIKNS